MIVTWKSGLAIAVAGAVGGLLYWVLTLYVETAVFASLPLPGRILACAAIGAAAALGGAFYLSASGFSIPQPSIFTMLRGNEWPLPPLSPSSLTYSRASAQTRR